MKVLLWYCKRLFHVVVVMLILFLVVGAPARGFAATAQPLSAQGVQAAQHGLAPQKEQGNRTTFDVLLLNSYHPGYSWNVSLLAGMHQVLDKGELPLRIRYEYMDAKHYATGAIVGQLRDLYRQKYANIRFNVIIASDNDAFHFAQRYRDELFPGAAVVFCGVNGYGENSLRQFKNVTGTAESFDIPGTIELALRLHPTARNLIVVGGVDTTSQINRELVREIMAQRFSHIRLLDYGGLNVKDLGEKLRDVPRNSVVLYLSYCLTPDDTRMSVQESIALVARLTNLPMYSAWAYQLTEGMVGGKMLRAEDQGSTAAEIALRILRGEKADDIPVQMESPTYYMFDAAMLKKFGIARSSLPPDSILINEDTTLFGRYRLVVLLALGFMIYQSLMIVWLLMSVRRRKRAEEQLRRDQALRLQLEEQLFHSQKLEAIDTFAGGIAHDFSNILESISCCCELVLEEVPPQSTEAGDVRQALRAAQRGKALSRRLLDFSRRTPTHVLPVSLACLVEECLEMVRPLLPSNVELSSHIQQTPLIMADADQLTQVVMNLCINAGQAMREQGAAHGGDEDSLPAAVLRVEVESLPAPDADSQGQVQLRVSDTGCGIAPEALPRIFDPFFTTRPKGAGTGLGLAVAQGIVHRHNGSIQAANGPHGGAVFTVLFPEAVAGTVAVPEEYAAPLCGGEEHLLLADDSMDVARPLARRLERLGYVVTVASCATEALERQEKLGTCALLLTDYDMPDMNGVELARRMRQHIPHLPVLLFTGMEREALPEDAVLRQVGIHTVLQKPVEFTRLARLIRTLLDAPLLR